MTGKRKQLILLLLMMGIISGCATTRVLTPSQIIKKSKKQTIFTHRNTFTDQDIQELNKTTIPNIVKSLQRRRNQRTLDQWQGSKAEKGIMKWSYNQKSGKFEPLRWMIPVKKNNKVVGIVAIDPKTKKSTWRIEGFFGKGEKFAEAVNEFPKKEIAAVLLKSIPADKQKSYDINNMVLASVYAHTYYMIPVAGRKPNEYLFIPIEDKTQLYTFEEVLQRRGLLPETGKSKEKKAAKFNLEPSEPVTVTAGTTTKLVNELPIFDQKSYPNCWAYALAIVHQWWSPRNLGCSDYQTDLIRYYKKIKTSSGATNSEVNSVMKNWDKVKEKWDDVGVDKIGSKYHATNSTFDGVDKYWENKTWNDDFPYEDFGTTWKGEGKKFGQHNPTWKSNDIKSWLALEAPVLVSIDHDGNDDSIDHMTVIAGYDDTAEEVYAIDPNGFQKVYGYSEFNSDYWGVSYGEWEWVFFPVFRYKRHGMVAGMPGDKKLVKLENTQATISTAISDSYTGSVRDIKMKLGSEGDDGFSGTDGYGDIYQPGVKFTVTKGKITNLNQGGFDQKNMANHADESWVRLWEENQIAPGTEIGTAMFNVEKHPDATTTELDVKGKFTVYDKNNRSHFQTNDVITVFDDYSSYDGTGDMRKPVKYESTKEVSQVVDVNDDDTAGPTYERISAYRIIDDSKSEYKFIVEVSDASGVASVRSGRRYSTESNFGSWHDMIPMGNNRYAMIIPHSEWINHVGEGLIIKVEATDNDHDQDNDQLTSTEEFYMVIEDDDKYFPQINDYEITADAKGLQFLVQLRDDSGIAVDKEYPAIYYNIGQTPSTRFRKLHMTPYAPKGDNWFVAQTKFTIPSGYTIEDFVNENSNKAPLYVYWKLKTRDLDNDRDNDMATGTTGEKAEHIAGRKRARNIKEFRQWKYGIRLKPQRIFTGILPEKEKPVILPEFMDDMEERRIGMDYVLDGVENSKSLVVELKARTVTGGDYYVRAKQVDSNGKVTILGTYAFSEKNKTVKVAIPKASTSASGNTLILESANIPADKTRKITWESMTLKENKRLNQRPGLEKIAEKEKGQLIKKEEKQLKQ